MIHQCCVVNPCISLMWCAEGQARKSCDAPRMHLLHNTLG